MTTRASRAYAYPDMTSFGGIDDAGRDLAILNYILCILGFFTGITAIIALMLAYLRRANAVGVVRSHLDWQIRIVWHGLLALLVIGVLHTVIIGLGAITFGVGLVFLVVPWALGLAWLVWTAWAIARGMQRLGRNLPIR